MSERIRPARALSAAAIATMTLLLSGCFIAPLVDGRSPFDDPFGPSNGDIRSTISDMNVALSGVDTDGGRWVFRPHQGAEDCSGDCNLYVELEILPALIPANYPDGKIEHSDVFEEFAVPTGVLRDVLTQAVPVAQQHKVNLVVQAGTGDPVDVVDYSFPAQPKSTIDRAAGKLFGTIEDQENDDRPFSVWQGGSSGVNITAHTREFTNVLGAMALN